MPSHSQTAQPHTIVIVQHSQSYELDTTSIRFQPTVDLGSVAIGVVECRASVLRHDEWVAIEELDDPALADGGMLLDDYLVEQQGDPEMAEALRRARVRIASQSAQHGASGLALLRLKAGLSQKQLAERLGTHQPNIARWERRPEQMTYSSITQLAEALGVNEQAIFDAQRVRDSLDAKQAQQVDSGVESA